MPLLRMIQLPEVDQREFLLVGEIAAGRYSCKVFHGAAPALGEDLRGDRLPKIEVVNSPVELVGSTGNAPGRSLNIDWDAQPLGEMTDLVLANRLGVSSSTVSAARRLRKIKSFSSRKS